MYHGLRLLSTCTREISFNLLSACRDYRWKSVIHGHHIIIHIRYLDNRNHEILCCEQERGNLEDPYIVSVMKGDTKLSTFCMKNHIKVREQAMF